MMFVTERHRLIECERPIGHVSPIARNGATKIDGPRPE